MNGKQKAYVINQNEMPTANPEELTRFNKIIKLKIAMLSNLLAVLKKGKNVILKVVKFTI